MEIFIKKVCLFTSVTIIFLLVACNFWFQYYSVPPPHISNSISFNAKALFLKNNAPSTNVDIIAIGSSMSLNNIHSNALVKTFDNEHYLNVSSWGLRMGQIFSLLKIFNKRYHPKTIIISSNYIDFEKQLQKIKYNALNEYLSTKFPLFSYLKEWNLSQSIQDSRLLSLYTKNKNSYASLNFDKYGAILYPLKNFKINLKKWNGDAIKSDLIDKTQYAYLDSIATYCYTNSIKFVFVQSPFREGYYSKLKKDELIILNNHIDKVKTILNDKNATFVNTLNKVWKDSLFVDYTHFNVAGSLNYTEYFLQHITMHQPTTVFTKNRQDRSEF